MKEQRGYALKLCMCGFVAILCVCVAIAMWFLLDGPQCLLYRSLNNDKEWVKWKLK